MAISATNATAILEALAVSLSREGRTILRDVAVRVARGEIHALLGVNGCGKSSLAYAIMGCADYRLDAGRISFAGRDITELPIHARARLGLTLAWQEPARFEGLLVGDYLTLARPDMTRDQLWAALQAVALDPPAYLRAPSARRSAAASTSASS
jgi:Fe-S cluster assembly ATP-binding protein